MRVIVVAALVLSLSLAGCGDKDKDEDFVTPEKDAQGRYVIKLTSDQKFSPAKAKVPQGAIVLWKVEGGTHTVEAEDGSFDSTDGFNSAFMSSGDDYAWLAEESGDYPYGCGRHPGMTGILRVR